MRKRLQSRAAEYQKVVGLHDEDELPFMRHDPQRESGTSGLSYELGLGHWQITPYVPEEHRELDAAPEGNTPTTA